MNNFKFKLQKVLDYKITIENLDKASYGKAKNIAENCEKELNNLVDFQKNTIRDRDESLNNMSLNDLRNYNSYITKLNTSIKNKKVDLSKAEKDVESAREKLVNSTIEKNIFLKLKDRDYSGYQYEVKKEEEKLTDQIISFKCSTR